MLQKMEACLKPSGSADGNSVALDGVVTGPDVAWLRNSRQKSLLRSNHFLEPGFGSSL